MSELDNKADLLPVCVTSNVKFQPATGLIQFVLAPWVEKISPLLASLHGGGGPQVGEVTRLGVVTPLSI